MPRISLLPGTNDDASAGTLLNPSMADVTEIGGVMIPSANKVPAPIIAGMASHLPYRLTKAYNENMPPSPWLSACRVMKMYLKVVCKVSVQNIQEMEPKNQCLVYLPALNQ